MKSGILIAAAMFFSLVLGAIVASAGNKDGNAPEKNVSLERLKSGSEEELSFEGVDFKTDPFFIYELYDRVKYRKVRNNISGGVTPRGLSFSVSW